MSKVRKNSSSPRALPFLHEHQDFKDLLDITAREEGIFNPALIEKDYWLMHILWGLTELKLSFDLKGGTSLSKGHQCIHRFSEDIDLKIDPSAFRGVGGYEEKVYVGKNQDDKKHRESRQKYFDWVAHYLQGKIPGVMDVVRDEAFDDRPKFRNGGVRILYKSFYATIPGLKEGILLEIGFDQTAPNKPCLISSWAYDRALKTSTIAVIDNRAKNVPCYAPEYTFVEKLQAVIRKFRLYKEGREGEGASLPANFIRHYYDLYQLIDRDDVQSFIGTTAYEAYKKERFGRDDTKISNSDAFKLSDSSDRAIFEREYSRSESLYFKGRPTLTQILERIGKDLERL